SAQLRALPEDDARALAARILDRHLDLLAGHDLDAIAAATGADLEAVRRAVSLVLSLRPHPVQAPVSADDRHILPDVIAWRVGLDLVALAAATRAVVGAVRRAVWPVLSLRQHPVQAPVAAEDGHIVPDVIAWRAGGGWRVALSSRGAPRVRIAPNCERALAG